LKIQKEKQKARDGKREDLEHRLSTEQNIYTIFNHSWIV
jgi:hypothetical protein